MSRKIALPGLSRSTTCRTKSCARLEGHRGEHRSSLHASPKATTAAAPRRIIVGGLTYVLQGAGTRQGTAKRTDTEGVEVLSADKYTVQPEPKARKARKVAQCRVTRDGVRCARAYGHKQAGKRHSFAGVRILAEATTPDRTQPIRTKRQRTRGYIASSVPSRRLA